MSTTIPPGFLSRHLRLMCVCAPGCRHARVCYARLVDVRGAVNVSKCKKVPAKLSHGQRLIYSRFVYDSKLMLVLTDQHASDFIQK